MKLAEMNNQGPMSSIIAKERKEQVLFYANSNISWIIYPKEVHVKTLFSSSNRHGALCSVSFNIQKQKHIATTNSTCQGNN